METTNQNAVNTLRSNIYDSIFACVGFFFIIDINFKPKKVAYAIVQIYMHIAGLNRINKI